jgi:pimeloyl-ACP methyl ester carboxylesterase
MNNPPAPPTFVLIHSPLVGPETWQPVADALRARGVDALVPSLSDAGEPHQPYWRRHAGSAAAAIRALPEDRVIVLVAHSGAGALLPAIRTLAGRPAAAYLFVDAGIHADGRTRLETFGTPDDQRAFRDFLEEGGRFPTWTDNDLRDIVPDAATRAALIAGLRPRGLDFFVEPIPVPPGWPDAPCAYLHFSPPDAAEAERARHAGWPVHEMPAGHFHMLVAPDAVAAALLTLAEEAMRSRPTPRTGP